MFLAAALAAAAVATVFSVRACAAGQASPAATEWQAGTNYLALARPQTTQVPAGKVEVAEVFWYGCGHCYALDPALENWKRKKPEFIEFVRIPVVWSLYHMQHARLYYTLLALGRGDLHPKVFDAIHRDRVPLTAETDQEARALQLAFLKQHGVSEKQFNAAYDSAEVKDNCQRANSLTAKYEVASVPIIIVNGTYMTSETLAGGTAQLLTLINDLAAREQRR